MQDQADTHRLNQTLSGRCQSNANQSPNCEAARLSGRQLTPLSQSGRAVLLEDVAAVEVMVEVEMVVDRGVNGGEFLQGLYISELPHRSFSSSEWLVGILGSIVEPPTALLIGRIPITFIADRYDRSRSVTIDRGRP